MRKTVDYLLIIGGIILLLFVIYNGTSFFQDLDSTQSVSDIGKMEINTESVNVEIIPENRTNLQASLKGWGKNGKKLTVKKEEETIKIDVDKKWISVSLPFTGASLEVRVPEHYKENLQTEIKSGNLTFAGTENLSLKQLSLKGHSGNIYLNGLNAEKIATETRSGNVNLNKVTAQSTSVHVRSGNLTVKNFKGPLSTSTRSGNAYIQPESLTAPIHAKTRSGNLKVNLPNENTGFMLDARVNSGNINSDFELQDAKMNDHQITGSYGDGTYDIKLETNSGNITID